MRGNQNITHILTTGEMCCVFLFNFALSVFLKKGRKGGRKGGKEENKEGGNMNDS